MRYSLSAKLATAALALGFGFAAPATLAQKKVQIEVAATMPEFAPQERGIWDLYEEQNPGVEIKIIQINEDTEAAYNARVAAGNPVDIRNNTIPVLENYKIYQNLLEIGYPHFDKLNYDARNIFEVTNGVPGYLPALNIQRGNFSTFIFYADEMKKSGLDPKTQIRTVDDLRAFLEKLKAYTATRKDLQYVLDMGWHPLMIGRVIVEAWAIGMGASKADIRALYAGDIKWTDLDRNPLLPAIALYKEFTDKGYLPPKWWQRAWETEFEASFIGRKSILTFHGPWLWTKVLAQNPRADIDGFFFPPNKDGLVWTDGTTQHGGSALYEVNRKKANHAETVKAFTWWNGPEAVKLRAEALGFLPALDVSSAGGVKLTNPQFVRVIKPALDANVKFDTSVSGRHSAERWKKKGTPYVLTDDAFAPILGDYIEGRTDLAGLAARLQQRWNTAYAR